MTRAISTQFIPLTLLAILSSSFASTATGFQLENNTDVILDPSSKIEETGDREFRPKLGAETVVKYKIGTIIKTANGSVGKVRVYLPVPNIWPEQSVTIENEKISDRAGKIKYRVLDGGVKQMLISISKIPPNTTEEVSITYRIAVKGQSLPKTTEGLIKPKKKLTKAMRYALGSSPGIDPKNKVIRKTLKKLYEKDTPAWEKGELIHQWVMENTSEGGIKRQNTAEILKSKSGKNEDRLGLFIAMMRAEKIPCRMVITNNTGYAEFCLQTPSGKNVWYPCQIRGSGNYGKLNRAMPIFQKGDNIRMPEIKGKKRNRVIAEHVTLKGHVQPSVRFIRQVVN